MGICWTCVHMLDLLFCATLKETHHQTTSPSISARSSLVQLADGSRVNHKSTTIVSCNDSVDNGLTSLVDCGFDQPSGAALGAHITWLLTEGVSRFDLFTVVTVR